MIKLLYFQYLYCSFLMIQKKNHILCTLTRIVLTKSESFIFPEFFKRISINKLMHKPIMRKKQVKKIEYLAIGVLISNKQNNFNSSLSCFVEETGLKQFEHLVISVVIRTWYK